MWLGAGEQGRGDAGGWRGRSSPDQAGCVHRHGLQPSGPVFTPPPPPSPESGDWLAATYILNTSQFIR